jgi:uncharacterized protein (DUF4415 family)
MPRLKPTHINPAPEEEEEISRGIALDPDAPELDNEWFARARPAMEVHPELVEYSLQRRGKQKAPIKERVTIRLDADIAARLRSSGPGWQTRLNEMLRRTVFER